MQLSSIQGSWSRFWLGTHQRLRGHLNFSQQQGSSSISLALAGSVLAVGMVSFGSVKVAAAEALTSNVPTDGTMLPSIAPSVPTVQSLQDGTYLYGQSPHAGTIGSTYMVFDVHGQDVVGAFYMPYSSFDCFRGSFQTNELALTIRDSYENELFAYSVPLVRDNAIASSEQSTQTPQHPEGFYPIADLSETDQQILSTCRAQTW